MLKEPQRDPKLGLSSICAALVYAFRNPARGVATQTLPATDAFRRRPGRARARRRAGGAAARPAARIGDADELGADRRRSRPSTVHVAVQNGAGSNRCLGEHAQTALQRPGFQAVGAATNADRSDYTVTEVRYGPARRTRPSSCSPSSAAWARWSRSTSAPAAPTSCSCSAPTSTASRARAADDAADHDRRRPRPRRTAAADRLGRRRRDFGHAAARRGLLAGCRPASPDP